MMNIHVNNSKECWIGLAHVKPENGNDLLGDATGAYVPILALAKGFDDFISIVTTCLESYDFKVIEIEDIEPFHARIKKSEVSEEIKSIAESLSKENPVAMDTFQAY